MKSNNNLKSPKKVTIDTNRKLDDVVLNALKSGEVLSTSRLGKHFASLYKHKNFLYVNESLYYFNGIFWVKDNKKMCYINLFIANDYYEVLCKIISKFTEKALQDKNHEAIKLINDQQQIVLKLADHKKRETFIKDIICYLVDNEIKFDNIPDLFAFKNKIYDLKTHSLIDGKPDQYITLHTGYDYDEEYDKDKIIEKELDILLNSIFPDSSVKDFYLTCLSLGLIGINNELFIIANGNGRNGKGVLNELACVTFGSYSYVMPSNILLQPLKIGSNPEIANMENKRIIFSREPDSTQQLCSGTIKELTGGSEINARLNHSNDCKTTLKSIFFLECNNKPKISEVTNGDFQRLKDVPFESTAIDETDYLKLEPNDRKNMMIKNIKYKTNEWKNDNKQALFNILIGYYKKYRENNNQLPVSEKINKRTKEYCESSDIIFDWLSDNYTKNNDGKIKLKEIYNSFKSSEQFLNLNIKQKSQYMYKNFIAKLDTNVFLRKNIVQNSKDVYELHGYERKSEETDDEDEEQEIVKKSALDL